MAFHVVIGKGPAGVATTRLLAQRGHRVRVISRTGGVSHGSVEHHTLDVATQTDELINLTAGANAIYNCGGPPYHRWTDDWPPFAEALLVAAEKARAVLVLTGNLYAYGPTDGPMTEDLPLAAHTAKGRVRAQVWQTALQRHRDGRVRVVEARSSDFIGPDVTAGGHLAERVVPALLRGRRPRVLGNPDAVHSWTYVPDVARALVRLAEDDRAWGRAWHVPTSAPYSTQAAVEHMCRIAGVTPVRASATPWWLLRGLGLFSPTLRELPELSYQFDRPFIIDSTAYSSTFGAEPTSADRALTATVAWWQRRLAGTDPHGRTAETAATPRDDVVRGSAVAGGTARVTDPEPPRGISGDQVP
jgi:nucleoside-diphosphate-sugar epimerase